jgi:hypothetical protein
MLVTDLFADPSVSGRIYALASPTSTAGPGAMLVSNDFGATLTAALAGDAGGNFTGVESARAVA